MIVFDYSKLLGRLREKGLTQDSLADALGIARPTLYKKLCGESEFRESEIEKTCRFLEIPMNAVADYFFKH